MKAAVDLSSTALGTTLENPAVGAILVWPKDEGNIIIGRGVTAINGRPHAETQAIAEAKRSVYGLKAIEESTIYVTLEPCTHYGKTPPCVDAIINAKLRRAVVSLCDIDERVAMQGVAKLREAGIEVAVGVLDSYAYNVLSRYFINKKYSRCEVTLKLALSQNAAIGQTSSGNFNITNGLSKKISHKLRSKHDAILIGTRTALLDNPLLSCRLPGLENRAPVRIILDTSLQLSLDSQIVKTARQQPVWIVCSQLAERSKKQALSQAGAKLLEVDLLKNGQIDILCLLNKLYNLNIFSLLVEGGAAIAQSFLNLDLVDRLALFTSPVNITKNPLLAPDLHGINSTNNYRLIEQMSLNSDIYQHWIRIDKCLQA